MPFMSTNRNIERRVECCLCGENMPQKQSYDLSLDPNACFENKAKYYDHSTGEVVFGPIEIYGYVCKDCARKLDYVLRNWPDLNFMNNGAPTCEMSSEAE